MRRPEWIDFHPDPRVPRPPSRWRFWYWRRRRARCFHHERPSWARGAVDSRSWIREELIDLGRRKLYVCEKSVGGCGRMWIIP